MYLDNLLYDKETVVSLTKAAKGVIKVLKHNKSWYREGWVTQEGGYSSAVYNCIMCMVARLEKDESLEQALKQGGRDYMVAIRSMYSTSRREERTLSLEGWLADFQDWDNVPLFFLEGSLLIEPSAEEEVLKNVLSFRETTLNTPGIRSVLADVQKRMPKGYQYLIEYLDFGGCFDGRSDARSRVAALHGVKPQTVAVVMGVTLRELRRILTGPDASAVVK